MSNKEDVVAALRNDAFFRATIPNDQRPIMEAFAAELPEVLRDYMALPVTTESLLKSKRAILAHVLEGDRLTTLLKKAMGVSAYTLLGGMAKMALETMLQSIDEAASDIPSILKHLGTTEEEFMLSERTNLSPENANKYRAGTLTIGDLVYTQPFVLINNT